MASIINKQYIVRISAAANLSEMVFSRSTNAPPHMKRISFVSICKVFKTVLAQPNSKDGDFRNYMCTCEFVLVLTPVLGKIEPKEKI